MIVIAAVIDEALVGDFAGVDRAEVVNTDQVVMCEQVHNRVAGHVKSDTHELELVIVPALISVENHAEQIGLTVRGLVVDDLTKELAVFLTDLACAAVLVHDVDDERMSIAKLHEPFELHSVRGFLDLIDRDIPRLDADLEAWCAALVTLGSELRLWAIIPERRLDIGDRVEGHDRADFAVWKDKLVRRCRIGGGGVVRGILVIERHNVFSKP